MADKQIGFGVKAATRIKNVVIRVERQPYFTDAPIRWQGRGTVVAPYYCQPPSNTNGATGTFPSGNSNGSYVMTSFVANVYQSVNGVLSKVATNATIFNPYGAAVVASKTCRVTPDGTGAYNLDAESCT